MAASAGAANGSLDTRRRGVHDGGVPPAAVPVCRLCGIGLRDGDDAVRIDGELFHAPCAQPAFSNSPSWRHAEVGVLNGLAVGAAIAHLALG